MTTTTATGRTVATSGAIRNGATLMAVAAAGFIGYAVLFLVRNATDSFLELGIGRGEVNVSKDQIQQFGAGAQLAGKGLLDARATTRPPGISPGHGSRDPR